MQLKKIGGVEIRAKHRATCHCGSVEIELDLPNGVVNPRRCDCSICRRKGAVVASVPLDGLHIVKGAEHLKLYQFNTRTAKHYFCSNCGIYTHHQRRSNPQEYGYNVGCLEGVNPLAISQSRQKMASTILQTGLMPNNSFKPSPLRGPGYASQTVTLPRPQSRPA